MKNGARRLRLDLPAAVFVAVELVALPLWLTLGRNEWFAQDEWDFLAARKATNLGDLFRGHNVHWVTLPVLTYRFLFWAFGLRTYFPYRLVAVLVHLVAAALLLVVMRRAAVRPWIATAAASLFVLLGSGWQNIVQPFQICFTGALAFGLAHLLLADHDGPFDRRDAFGLGAGLLGLMCSGVGVTMVGVVGVTVLLRRGWRLALVHTAPLAAVYLVWLVTIGHDGYGDTSPTLHGAFGFVGHGLRGAYREMAQVPGLGVVLAVMLAAGLVLGWQQRSRRPRARPGRACGAGRAPRGIGRLPHDHRDRPADPWRRHRDRVALPLHRGRADPARARGRRRRADDALALVPPDRDRVVPRRHPGEHRRAPRRATTRTDTGADQRAPRHPLVPTRSDRVAVPRTLVPDPLTARQVTIGWLLDGVASGRVPARRTSRGRDRASTNFRLSFDQRPGPSPTTGCFTLRRPPR